MNADKLVFSETPHVYYGTNTFIDVPVIIQYDTEPLIEVVEVQKVAFTSQISIYHPDGTYLAKVKGPRLYLTEPGKKVNLEIRDLVDTLICELDGRTLFELRKLEKGWEVDSELYTSDGRFVKARIDLFPQLIGQSGPLLLKGTTLMNNTFIGVKIGLLIGRDGSLSIGVSGE